MADSNQRWIYKISNAMEVVLGPGTLDIARAEIIVRELLRLGVRVLETTSQSTEILHVPSILLSASIEFQEALVGERAPDLSRVSNNDQRVTSHPAYSPSLPTLSPLQSLCPAPAPVLPPRLSKPFRYVKKQRVMVDVAVSTDSEQPGDTACIYGAHEMAHSTALSQRAAEAQPNMGRSSCVLLRAHREIAEDCAKILLHMQVLIEEAQVEHSI